VKWEVKDVASFGGEEDELSVVDGSTEDVAASGDESPLLSWLILPSLLPTNAIASSLQLPSS
jgi:hypothetical protein